MRDVNRIPSFLKRVEEVWKIYPDMRFGQLVIYLHHLGTDGKKHPDLFSIEEQPIADGIEILLKRMEK